MKIKTTTLEIYPDVGPTPARNVDINHSHQARRHCRRNRGGDPLPGVRRSVVCSRVSLCGGRRADGGVNEKKILEALPSTDIQAILRSCNSERDKNICCSGLTRPFTYSRLFSNNTHVAQRIYIDPLALRSHFQADGQQEDLFPAQNTLGKVRPRIQCYT